MEKKRDIFFLESKKQQSAKLDIKQKFKNKDESQKKFDLTRNGLQEPKQEGEKKPFDKKTYRLKKYSKKYKLEKWEEQRKKKMLNEYQKSLKHDPMVGSYKPKSFDEDITDSAPGRFVKHPNLIEKELKEGKHKNSILQANKKKQEKVQKQEEIEKIKQERKQKLEEYKKQKHDRFKKLSKKNKKGQPMMTGRMELLLEKIQNPK